MTLNEILLKQSVLAPLLIKSGDDELSKELTNFVDFYNDRQIRSERIPYDEIEIYLDSRSAE